MAYFIFLKNLDNVYGTLSRIAENQSDLTNLNIIESGYKIIEDSQSNFDSVKYGFKYANEYNNNTIIFEDAVSVFNNKEILQNYINIFKIQIKEFLDVNSNHPLFTLWNNYYNQLNNLNLNNITYPLNSSLEQYFKDQNLTSLNPLYCLIASVSLNPSASIVKRQCMAHVPVAGSQSSSAGNLNGSSP